MKIIVGLGNPGQKYANTRHNVGFMVLDHLSANLNTAINKSKFNALIGESYIGQERVILVKPQTYMNLSGEAVGALARWYKVNPSDVIVVYDDMDLPLGKLRIRPKGGAGGHNGMKSIIAHLGTTEFPRIRIGIGRSEKDAVNYVLGNFNQQEFDIINNVITKAVESLQVWVRQDINAAMNKYNVN